MSNLSPIQEQEVLDKGPFFETPSKVMIRFRNRSRMRILADLLTAAKTGALKTHLMSKANLSCRMASLYLQFLLEEGLMRETIQEETLNRLCLTTAKGLKFLENYETLRELSGIHVG